MAENDNKSIRNPEEQLADILKNMKEARAPMNRVYEIILEQTEMLKNEFDRTKGVMPDDASYQRLDEKFSTISKLTDIYISSKAEDTNPTAAEQKQMDMVRGVRDVIHEQSDFIRDGRRSDREYAEASGKAVETAFSAVRGLGSLAEKKEAEAEKNLGKEQPFTDGEKDLVRFGMAAVTLHDRIMDAETGREFFDTYIKKGKDYGKALTTIAGSKEFKSLLLDKYSAKEIRSFISNKDAPKELWSGFEKKIVDGRKLEAAAKKAKEAGKEKAATKAAPAKEAVSKETAVKTKSSAPDKGKTSSKQSNSKEALPEGKTLKKNPEGPQLVLKPNNPPT